MLSPKSQLQIQIYMIGTSGTRQIAITAQTIAPTYKIGINDDSNSKKANGQSQSQVLNAAESR